MEVTEVLRWPLVFTQVFVLSAPSQITVSCLFCQFPLALKKASRVKETASVGAR